MSTLGLLSPAPSVVRVRAEPRRPSRVPAAALVILGLILVVVPVAAGLFGKVAAGQQLLTVFQPHLQPDALSRYQADLATVSAGREAVVRTYARDRLATGRFPGLDAWRSAHGAAIQPRAQSLLTTVEEAVPDYTSVQRIGGFDRIPFLIVGAGLGLTYAGVVLVAGRRRNYRPALALALGSSAALITFPFLSGLSAHSSAAVRLLHRLEPVVTRTEVLALQHDFVTLVTAEGEVDTQFRAIATGAEDRRALTRLRTQWPQISSDLAGLVGDLNDSIADLRALKSLNALGGPWPGFQTLPWVLVGAGAIGAALVAASIPRTLHRPKRSS